jgi:glycerol-1-phosphate dehydrogenase [NAD(P)+]
MKKEIGYFAKKIDKILKENGFHNKKIILVSDQKIWKNCQKFFPKNLPEKMQKILLLKNAFADEENLEKINKAAIGCDLIFAIGSGTINDLCKLSSANLKIPYLIFASAASMNGYLSKNASITINHHKKTLSATLPIAVFCDLKILSATPQKLTKAGIGDVMCFYSCWFDWYLSHLLIKSEFNQKPFLILLEKMIFFLNNFQKFNIKSKKFLKILIDILLTSGEAMTIAKGSYPASQSEHLIAHCITLKYPKIANKTLHGQLIAITTLTSAKLQENILKLFLEKKFSYKTLLKNYQNLKKEIFNFFEKEVAEQCEKEFRTKFSEYHLINEDQNFMEIGKKLKKVFLPTKKIKEIFYHFKINTSLQSIKLSQKNYSNCVLHAKFIRNRFTCLDLLK